MKKIILVWVLILSITTAFSQQEVPQQFRRVYTEVAFTIKGEVTQKEAENVMLFNYCNNSEIKIYMSDGNVKYFIQITDREEGSTDGGMTYSSAIYQEKYKTLKMCVQLFKDREYGCRFIFKNGDMVQFIE